MEQIQDRRQALRRLRQLAGLSTVDSRLDEMVGPFSSLVDGATRLRNVDVGLFEPACVFRADAGTA